MHWRVYAREGSYQGCSISKNIFSQKLRVAFNYIQEFDRSELIRLYQEKEVSTIWW